MTALQQRLKSLKYHATKYEIVATHKDGRKVLVGYTPRKGRQGLWAMVAKNATAWIAFSGEGSLTFAKRAADGATAGDWNINFSGRTQRDAIINGELPFFAKEAR